MLPVQVVARTVIAPDVVSVFIVLPGTRQAPAPYLPGQFVTLALPTARETLYRSYSLCGDGDATHPWELAIKRMDKGAVSTYFYNSVRQGTLLYASLPRGTFTLPSRIGPETNIVMVALGSGITPIMGMLRAIERMPPSQRPLVQLHYASPSWEEMIFGQELDEMDPDETWLRQYHYLSSEGDRMRADAVTLRVGKAATRAYWYMCGSESFKADLQARLAELDVPQKQVHSEVFATKAGPAYRVEARNGTGIGGQLQIAETGASLDVRPEETVLTALERHGYHPNFSCRAGACGECKVKVLAGQVDPVGEALSATERSEGYVLSCLARPIGEVTLASGGRPPSGVQRLAVGAGADASGVRAAVTPFVRLSAILSTGALLLGTWMLTDHRPASWDVVGAAPAGTPTATDVTPTAAPTQVHTPTAAHPVPTTPGQGGSVAPTPKPTPKPKPTCVSTKSKPC
jgi:ferredoxin-NADP reductase